MAKQYYLMLLMFFAGFVVDCQASSTLVIDQDFNVISVNGQSHESGFLTTDTTISLHPGVNKIAIEYEVVFDQDDNFDLIKSDTLLISFYSTRDKSYVLNYLKPANSRAARIFAKNPVISILDQTGTQLKSSSYFLGSNSEGFINQQTRPSIRGQQPIKIISDKKKSRTNSKQSANKSLPSPEPAANAEEKLEYWWNKATTKQRQSFLKKISKE